jgi:hypothetical protein
MTDETEIDEGKIAGRRPELERLLMSYFACKHAIHKFFSFEPGWREIPISDDTEYWWLIEEHGDGGVVRYGEGDVKSDRSYYSSEIYTTRHLKKYVYRTETHTAIAVDTQTDGNVFLNIFDNAKEVTDPELVAYVKEHKS